MMNRENPSLQRDQMKRPGFNKLNNSNSNGFSSPFPFMEFSLNNQSSLNNVLNNFSREYSSSNRSLPVKPNATDPYLKPLSLDRLKSANGLNREITNNSLQYNQNFIKFSSNNLKTNDFSANFFLRIQSTKTDNISDNIIKNSNYQKTGDLKNTQNQSNGINKLYRENSSNGKIITSNNSINFNGVKRENTLIPNSQNLKSLTNENSKENETYFIRPNTAGLPLRSFKETVPIALMPPSAKFYVKSFKTDALIYNPTLKSSQTNVSINKPDSNLQSNIKIPNSQNLYLQVKQEVEEYRKQRRKEGLLDINICPEIKTVTSEELYLTNGEIKYVEDTPNKISQSKVSTALNSTANNNKKEENITTKDNKSKEADNNKFYKRPKSVTFNDKVETRDFFGDVSRSESEDEESDEASSTENDSHGSIVSTESESEENDTTSNIIDKTNESSSEPMVEFKTLSPIETTDKTVNSRDTITESDTQHKSHESENETNSKCDSSCESTDTESESDSESSTKTEISSCKPESVFDKENSNDKINCSLNNVTKSRATSCSPQNVPSSNKQLRVSSSAKSLSNLERHHKRLNEVKVKGGDYLTKQELLEMNAFKETKNQLPLIFSKFSNVPPVVNFVGEGEKIEPLPFQLRKYLRWRTSLLTPVIVKQTIGRSGFKPSRFTGSGDDLDETESNDWILYFGKHMKGPVFKTIREYQKVNHFPGSFQLGRKDRLWRNIYRMQQEIGTHEFDFIPQTFCLPTDLELFKQCWESGGNKHKWIIKPPASARGIGVKVVYKWNQIPKRRPVIVQRYISNPYLINDSKFDLRLYVFITDINPLKIYLYDDGLVRFASTKYTNSVKSLHNRYVHLTNYSINKLNIEYLDNNDNEACKGHKWSIKSLWNYLKKRGVNTDNVWHKIKDLVVKTIISAEEAISASVNLYCKSTYSVQELFGFDVILDENLKPWILEVNVSPSLHSDSPLDIIIKGGMIKDMFNLSGFLLPEPSDVEPATLGRSKSPSNPVIPSSDLFIDSRFWLYEPSQDEIAKMKHFISVATNGTEFRFDSSDNLPYQILECLTPRDVRCLVQCLDEYNRRGHFERVYPITSIKSSKKYLSYFERIHYFNLLLTSFLTKYSRNDQGVRLIENMCQKKLHLLSAQNGDKIDSKHIWKTPNSSGDNY